MFFIPFSPSSDSINENNGIKTFLSSRIKTTRKGKIADGKFKQIYGRQ